MICQPFESKAEIYAEAGILEYWLVRPEDRAIDIYSESTLEGYLSKRTIRASDKLRCASIPGVEVALAEILPAR